MGIMDNDTFFNGYEDISLLMYMLEEADKDVKKGRVAPINETFEDIRVELTVEEDDE